MKSSEDAARGPVRHLNAGILLISAVGLGYQVALMRIFSIAQWHHFAYMIISIAMLGFGASGTALALVRGRLRGREAGWLRWSAVVLAASLMACYAASQRVPFETFELVKEPVQLWYLLALYVILAAPFFMVSTCITLGFFLAPERVARVYFFNMVGSGLGAAGIVGLLYGMHPARVPFVAAAVAGAAAVLLARGAEGRAARLGGYAVVILAVAGTLHPVGIRISQYKGLSYAKLLPDAEILGEWHSPISVITAVKSAMIRETPGQISNYSTEKLGELPKQIGLYFDGGGVSPVNEFEGGLERFAFLDYVTSALPYHLVEKPKALVIGPGGGSDVLSALYHGAAHVTAVELDPCIFKIVGEKLEPFAGDIYNRPDVTPVVAEGRGFLESHEEQYDLIQVPLLGSFSASSAGVYALSESYFYTKEALLLHLDRLSPDGVAAITVWLKTPARDALKMFATAVEACEAFGMEQPGDHLAFIRSWNNATIVISRAALSGEQVEAVRAFSRDRMLDVCYCPGIQPDEVNQYTLLEEPIYYEFASRVLEPQERERLYREALFFVEPATDDRPYFFRFFRWKSLPRLIEGLGTEWVPFMEWGYLTLIATILQGALTSVLLILLPLGGAGAVAGRAGCKAMGVCVFRGAGAGVYVS